MILSTEMYLGFYQHCHVHEHSMELSDAGLQADNVLMSGLDLIQGLTSDLGIRNDLKNRNHISTILPKQTNDTSWMQRKKKYSSTLSHSQWFTPPSPLDGRVSFQPCSNYKLFTGYCNIRELTSEVKIDGFPVSNMSSSSSLVVILPAETIKAGNNVWKKDFLNVLN